MTEQATTEQHIVELVRRFYERAMADDRLRPVFEAAIFDWDLHHRTVADFWSKVLLDTGRYEGHPYQMHAQLPLKPEHFELWLGLFEQTAREVLPEDTAGRAIARAKHMAESFKAGMFSFPVYEGPVIWKSAL
jgi:hemoglobin